MKTTLPPHYVCPACGRDQTEEAEPLARKSKAGGRQILAHRRRCTACGYQDRTSMFCGALSLNSRGGSKPAIAEDADNKIVTR